MALSIALSVELDSAPRFGLGDFPELAQLSSQEARREWQCTREVTKRQSARRVLFSPPDSWPASMPAVGELASVPAPTFPFEWTACMARSLDDWQTWETPVPRSHPLWSAPGPHPDISRHALQNCGRSPFLLALFGAQPRNLRNCQAISSHVESFLVWDSWLKRFSSAEECSGLSDFFEARQDDSGGPADSALFPTRLYSKFPLKRDSFCSALSEMCSDFASPASAARWREQYMRMWAVYAKDGLSMHRRISQRYSSKQAIDAVEFLTYRALVSGMPQLALLALGSQQRSPLSDSAMEQLLPLLGLASMVVALFSDLHLAGRGQQKQATSLSALEVFDDEWAAMMHRALLTQFMQQADVLLQADGGESGRSFAGKSVSPSIRQLVMTLKACVHGMCAWYMTAAAFRQRPGTAVQEVEGDHRLLDEEVGCDGEANTWVMGTVDKAVDCIGSLFRGSL